MEHPSKSIRAVLQKFETGQVWMRRKRRSRKNSESKVNDGRTPVSLDRHTVLDELNREGGGVEQPIESQ